MMSYNPIFMKLAIEQAKKASLSNEVPVGAIIVKKNKVIGFGRNKVISKKSVSAHAEILAINRAAIFLKNYRLLDCEMYLTLEPCHMCAKAIVDARISNLYFGAYEPKTGSVSSIDNFLDKLHLNHTVSYCGGYMQDESAKLLKEFFDSKRKKKIS